MRAIFSKFVRWYLTGADSDYRFVPARKPKLHKIKSVNLYVHIPFCKSLCPYCPYNKIKYDKALVVPYIEAILKEIGMYYRKLGRTEIGSIYIGGGTPTLLIDELPIVIDRIHECFNVSGDICIETNPHDMDKNVTTKLKNLGVGLVSLGVQSFNDNLLQLIGRPYSSKILPKVISGTVDAGFKSVNVDLIFSIGTQTIDDLQYDIEKAINFNVSQVTAYPLFTFPYTSVGRHRKLNKIKMPNIINRHKHYRFINKFMTGHGYNRVSVWSYEKKGAPRFSSVTRDGYIGIGAGAGSDLPDAFYLNTFSVYEYIDKCQSGQFPTALKMEMNEKMRDFFWLYWRLYDTLIPKKQIIERFNSDSCKLLNLLDILKWTGMTSEDENAIRLTDRGAFWVHLLQNYFVLENIHKVWSVAKEQSWPGEIVL